MLRLTAALRHYAGLVLAITVTGTAAGVLAARLNQPQYEARAVVWLGGDRETEPLRGRGPLRAKGWVEDATVLDSIAALLNGNVDIQADKSGRFLRLSLIGADPERTAEVLNAVVERLVEAAAKLKRAKLQELGEVLDKQLEAARGQLERATDPPESRRRPLPLTPPDFGPRAVLSAPQDSAVQDIEKRTFGTYRHLLFALDSVVGSREALVQALAGASNSASWADALKAIPTVERRLTLAEVLRTLREDEQELHRLRARYKNGHPQVLRVQGDSAAAERRIRELADAQVAELRARESELEEQIEAVGQLLARIRPRSIEEDRLERRRQSARMFYEALEARRRQVLQALARSMPDLRVLDRATPLREPANRYGPLHLVLAAFLISLAVAVLDAILLDRLDGRLENPSGLV